MTTTATVRRRGRVRLHVKTAKKRRGSFAKPLLLALGIAMAIGALTGGRAGAAEWPDADTVKAIIVDRAAAHGADAQAMLCTNWRESRFQPTARGTLGERGVAQWLPGRGNAWDETSAYRLQGIDIVREYERGNPDAVWFDLDGQAELFARGRGSFHWRSTFGRSC